ncbi:hypothetical protein Pla52n_11840 [Stieleria varia]|uniref:Uncharacterized protein n=1 Tax=Stieleria varia TaxID=2528005 RepID=A0A5C6B228_9BACT|nr:hypothetical protein Pla52n_11840 [Stieleria varia]
MLNSPAKCSVPTNSISRCDASEFRFFHEDHRAFVDDLPAPPQGIFSTFAPSLEIGLSHLGAKTRVRLLDCSELSDRVSSGNIFVAISNDQYSFWDGRVVDRTIQFLKMGAISSTPFWRSPLQPIEVHLMLERYPDIKEGRTL